MMRATVYFEHNRMMSANFIGSSHSLLNRTSVFTGSRILNTWVLYVSAFLSISSRVIGGRVVLRPVGSPMRPVLSPIRKITRCPRSWKCFILRSSTVCPRCRSGAVGSKPAFTRSGRPVFSACTSRSRSSSSRIRSARPFFKYCNCSSLATIFIRAGWRCQ